MPRYVFDIDNHQPTRVTMSLASSDEARREAIRTFGEIVASEADQLSSESSLQVLDENGLAIVRLVLVVRGLDGTTQP